LTAYYLDTSALTKLIRHEAETEALRAWLFATPAVYVTSDLTRAELLRAVRRHDPALAARAELALQAVTVLRLTVDTLRQAGRLDPDDLRTLDAIHLATALGLGGDLAALVTYDGRQADAAAHHGIRVLAPR
jgi:predicted nucleic acid-binding protein